MGKRSYKPKPKCSLKGIDPELRVSQEPAGYCFTIKAQGRDNPVKNLKQEIPRKLQKIMDLQNGETKPKKKITKVQNSVSKELKQKKGETVDEYEERLEALVDEATWSSKFQEKYSVTLGRDEDGIEFHNDDVLKDKKGRIINKVERKKAVQSDKKREKLREKRLIKKLKKEGDYKIDDSDILEKQLFFKEKIDPEERVSEPPNLHSAQILTKKWKQDTQVPKRQFLFMENLKRESAQNHSIKTTPSLARKRILEEERERVIAAYRDMKRGKLTWMKKYL